MKQEEEKEPFWKTEYREYTNKKAAKELPPKSDSAPYIAAFEDIQEFLTGEDYVIDCSAKETARFLKENSYTKKDIRGKSRWNFDLGPEYAEFRKKYDKCEHWIEYESYRDKFELAETIRTIWYCYTHNRPNGDYKLRQKYTVAEGQEYFEDPLALMPGSLVYFIYSNGKSGNTECWLSKYLTINEEKIDDELKEKLGLTLKLYKFLANDEIIYHGFFEEFSNRFLVSKHSYEEKVKLHENNLIEIYID